MGGLGENAGKYQVWTSLEDGTIIKKSGYTDWTQDEVTEEWTKQKMIGLLLNSCFVRIGRRSLYGS